MKSIYDFIDRETSRYIGLEDTLDSYSPSCALSRNLSHFRVYLPGDEDDLCHHHKRISIALTLLETKPEVYDRLRFELRRLPNIADVWGNPFTAAEFSMLSSFKSCLHGINEQLCDLSDLEQWLDLPVIDDLDEGLLGPVSRSSFSLSDDARSDLFSIRNDISEINARLMKKRDSIAADIENRYDWPRDIDEWVIDRKDNDLIYRLRSDPDIRELGETPYTVRFQHRRDALFGLQDKLQNLLAIERKIEAEILKEMESQIRSHSLSWSKAASRLLKLDFLLTCATMAKEMNAVAPLISDGIFSVENGRNDPLAKCIESEGEKYVALDFAIGGRTAVITGSNMGGKTVALQTIAWLQAMSQLGFFVPAKHFSTMLFNQVMSLSGNGKQLGGLSAFGREVKRLSQMLSHINDRALLLLDEPAKATAAGEGRAISRAFIEHVETSDSIAIVATHFKGLALSSTDCFRMGGLNISKLKAWKKADEKERKSLQSLMDFKVCKTSGESYGSDAIDVAEILGLDNSVIMRARSIYENEQE